MFGGVGRGVATEVGVTLGTLDCSEVGSITGSGEVGEGEGRPVGLVVQPIARIAKINK